MDKEQFELLIERHPAYGFYTFGGDEVVCTKLKDGSKYFIDSSGCNCKGFKSHGNCKHVKMIKDVWTPDHGTKSWFESEFDGIFETPELPEEGFNTAIVVSPIPHNYKIVCFTVEYGQYKMGVKVYDPSFNKSDFYEILWVKNARKGQAIS